jgi:D-3-phosphoglycerate dehydrogenase
MTAFNVLITDGLNENVQAILSSAANVDSRVSISSEELLQIIKDYDALIVRSRTQVTAEVIDATKRLKVIGRAGVGVDNIDLDAARENGIAVVNAPVSTTMAVAELTFGLMLSLAREIPRADAAMKRGEWPKKELTGVELNGKTLGILGMGRIGGEVGRRAVIFGMDVIAHDPLVPDEVIRQRWAKPASLDDLYAYSDYISFHLPLTDVTHSMLDEQAFGRMKRGVRIICAARGGIIDEPALLAALESGQVAGAALDVFAYEPPGATDLVKHPRVIAIPHIGAQTAEAQSRAAEDIAHEVLAALKGESLRWKIV